MRRGFSAAMARSPALTGILFAIASFYVRKAGNLIVAQTST